MWMFKEVKIVSVPMLVPRRDHEGGVGWHVQGCGQNYCLLHNWEIKVTGNMGDAEDPHLASEAYTALEESLTIRPRAYQWEVFEAAREGNVCAPDAADKSVFVVPSCGKLNPKRAHNK